MKLKHKELIIGIIIGSIIFGTISIFANSIFNVSPNPFKIKVNGTEKYIEGYNIDGYSYFKLRDIGEQVGFNVSFKENVIMIDIDNNDAEATLSDKNEDYNFITINNMEYIKSKDVDVVVLSYYPSWSFAYTNSENGSWTDENGSWCYLCKMINRDENGMVIEQEDYQIPCVFIEGIPYLTREIFENEILNRINE